jgi:helix-turn-helix protein
MHIAPSLDLAGPSEGASLKTLIPFAAEEAISIKEAAAIAGKSERTIRNLCVQHGLGRRIGAWAVSKVALAMWLDGAHEELTAYRDHGVRGSWEPVAKFYRRCGLAHLLERPEFAV